MSAEVAASVFPQLEALLPHVQKPIQYVGGELNSTVKPWEACDVRWALMYPDAYEVGLPNQGVMILYEVLNEREGVLAERTYSVWPDLEELMREHKVPQFTVDSHRPVKAFDVFGLSFSTELGYTNMLTALDLAGIPLESKDRTLDDPIVLAGGHAAFNPEPIADFIDAAIIGDGEQAVLDMTEIIRAWKAEGRPGGREEVLFRLAKTGIGVHPGVLRRRVPAGRPYRPRGPEQVGRPVARVQAHGHGPGRVAVPQAAPRPARGDGPRAHVGGDLPRLHTRLPLLPGGHDHPPGARALHHGHRRHGGEGPEGDGLRGGGPALPVLRGPLARSATSPRAWRTGTRRTRSACPSPRPAWTPSTSTWRTS